MPIACRSCVAYSLCQQIICSAFATVTTIIPTIRLTFEMGATGVMVARVLVYAVFVCGPFYIDAWALIRRPSATTVTFFKNQRS